MLGPCDMQLFRASIIDIIDRDVRNSGSSEVADNSLEKVELEKPGTCSKNSSGEKELYSLQFTFISTEQ